MLANSMKNEESTLISVVVPVYNVEKYVEKCLDSLSHQSYENIEVIVVDDGSTDRSGDICEEFAKKDKRIKVFHKTNGGLSDARNYGIKRAKGEYVCLVDSDDWCKGGFVEKMVRVALKEGADIVVCGYNDVVPRETIITGEEATIRLLVEQENVDIIAWNKMYRRSLFDDVSYPEGENYEDCLTTYKLLSKASRVAYLPKSLYCYRERAGSITQKSDKEERLTMRERAAREAMEYFAKSNKRLWKAAQIAMLTAKLAFMDFAISGAIKKTYYDSGRRWILDNKKSLYENQLLSRKLKTYIEMIEKCGGVGYKLFRKIRHE